MCLDIYLTSGSFLAPPPSSTMVPLAPPTVTPRPRWPPFFPLLPATTMAIIKVLVLLTFFSYWVWVIVIIFLSFFIFCTRPSIRKFLVFSFHFWPYKKSIYIPNIEEPKFIIFFSSNPSLSYLDSESFFSYFFTSQTAFTSSMSSTWHELTVHGHTS